MKRIIILADGTWNSPEKGAPTHVLRLARGIAPVDNNQNKQVVFYDWGVGTDRKKVAGGLTGEGIDKNIQDCYRFIVHNYQPDDQLFFFGFSRGAYTVRSLAGFIRNCGILKRAHADRIPEAYRLYRGRTASTSPDAPRAKQFRKKFAIADLSPIEYVGVWDTVGALGIPITFWGLLDNKEFLFHDTEPSKIIRHARHAVSIDESREDYAPALWTVKPGIDLMQVWFAGVHSDVGGGYEDHSLGDFAAEWILKEAAKCGLKVESHLTLALKPAHNARQHNEYKGMFKLRDSIPREVGPVVHQSVKRRFEDAKVKYKSPALKKLLDSVNHDWNRIELIE